MFGAWSHIFAIVFRVKVPDLVLFELNWEEEGTIIRVRVLGVEQNPRAGPLPRILFIRFSHRRRLLSIIRGFVRGYYECLVRGHNYI